MLTVGSLFSGIGGLDLGLERAGMEVRWQVEIDEWCNRILAKHWPDISRYGDVRELSGGSLEAVDVICGGFPWEPDSLAGKREAQADPRWLWPEFARLVDEVRPRYVLVENVPGLYSAGGAEVVADLASLGYDAEWHSVSAASMGAPHKRDRFFLVAYPHSQGSQGHWTERELQKASEEVAVSRGAWWAVEPVVGRVADGIPARVDRLRGLGNAVVPQVAEFVGRLIVADAQQGGRP